VAVAAVMLHFTPYIWEFQDTDISVCVCVCVWCVCVCMLYCRFTAALLHPYMWEFQDDDISVQVACGLQLLVYEAFSY
jgi:hypothetical protein